MGTDANLFMLDKNDRLSIKYGRKMGGAAVSGVASRRVTKKRYNLLTDAINSNDGISGTTRFSTFQIPWQRLLLHRCKCRHSRIFHRYVSAREAA